MKVQQKILAGVAVFAALALAGMVGIFAFSAAQPVQAQTTPDDVTRGFSATQVAPGGTVDVTITVKSGIFVDVAETLPAGWDYRSARTAGDSTATVTENGQVITFGVLNGEPLTYTVMAPDTAGTGTFSGMYAITGTPNIRIGGPNMVTVRAPGGGGGNGGGGDNGGSGDTGQHTIPTIEDQEGTVGVEITPITLPEATGAGSPFTYSVMGLPDGLSFNASTREISGEPTTSACTTDVTYTATDKDGNKATRMFEFGIDASNLVDTCGGGVTARPEDPGSAAQITAKFRTHSDLEIDDSITIEVDDNTGVPASIAAGNVSITGGAGATSRTASPRSVVVETDNQAERFQITLFVDDMSDEEGSQNLPMGMVTVTFRQEAGITNRTEGGSDDWFVYTSKETELAPFVDVYTVPRIVELSSYKDSRGEDITVTGKGFKNSTTVRFWRDADEDGRIDRSEVVLCTATASGADIAECSFTLSNPPFMGGKTGNYINATDGRSQEATAALPQIELEPSMSVDPKQGNPGDSVNVQLYDFEEGDTVTKIDFGRQTVVCDNNCPSRWGTVGPTGGLSFSFDIPYGINSGIQQLRVYAGDGDVDTNFTVGAGRLQLSSTDVLPNQRVHVSGSGFTTSQGGSPSYIGDETSSMMGRCGTKNAAGMYLNGSVTLGGDQIDWDRVNNGDAIKITSGGTWSASIDLPVNSLTTSAGTRELKIIDCNLGGAAVDLTFPDPDVTMSPEQGRVGSEVVITGKNFPVANDDGSDIEITVTYTSGDEMDDDDVEPDGLGGFTVILKVPEDAAIPSTNTVTVQYTDDKNAKVTETETHRIPQGMITFSTASGAEGSLLTITAEGFDRYTSVDEVLFDGRDVTPAPKPSTGTTGDVEFQVRIPGADPNVYIIEVTIDEVTASQTFTVVSGSGVVDGSVDSILANVISEEALDRVFKFDNATKEWQWYINDPAFASTNNLAGLSSGDLVWIKVSKSVTADILGTSTSLTCINEGAENEDCWNQISIP